MPEEPKGPRPTHELKLLDVKSGDNAQVGVAWEREEGYFSIKLSPGVVLSYDNLKGKVLTLFRARTQEEWDAFHSRRRAAPPTPETTSAKSGYDGNGGDWKKNHPDYVRKIHYNPATKQQCAHRAMGKPALTDDPARVTCGKCKKVIQGTERPIAPETSITPPESPTDPTPAA